MNIDVAVAMRTARREREASGSDLAPIVWFARAGQVVVRLDCPDVDRDQALWAAHIGVAGYCADSVVVAIDARIANGPRPGGGEWEPGDLQARAEEGASTDGVITDCLLTMELRRDGSGVSKIARYRQQEGIVGVQWLDERGVVGERSHHLVGLVPETLREAFQRGTTQLVGRPAGIPGDTVLGDEVTHSLLKQCGFRVRIPRSRA
jgi:hypothetical protein